jgi:hypothetical protein
MQGFSSPMPCDHGVACPGLGEALELARGLGLELALGVPSGEALG